MATATSGATLNMRLIQEINQNFALAYEGSYQYMDLKPEGYNVAMRNGSSTSSPSPRTFKVGDIGISSAVLKSGLYTSWMDWSKKSQ